MSEPLFTTPRRLNESEREDFRQMGSTQGQAKPVIRPGFSPPTVDILDSLLSETAARQRRGDWADRASSDRWLAPRVHSSLRLHRAEAADRGLWQWVALRHSWYLEWRWSDENGIVAEDRWWGPIHKQAFARLWWGAEMFRNGSDYGPVERAFVFQDLPNSYLHRPVVRCRSLALAIVDRFSDPSTATASGVNALARALNLSTAGSPPEAETEYQADDDNARANWVVESINTPVDWGQTPIGPLAVDTSADSVAGGRAIVERAWGYADLG